MHSYPQGRYTLIASRAHDLSVLGNESDNESYTVYMPFSRAMPLKASRKVGRAYEEYGR